jgi:hypothetical protein
MNKRKAYYLFGFISVSIVCFCILFYAFDIAYDIIMEKIVEAIFTGCILAIPGVIVFLVDAKKDAIKELDHALSNVKFLINVFPDNLSGYSPDLISKWVNALSKLHAKIEELLTDNRYFKSDILDELSNDLFKLVKSLRSLQAHIVQLSNDDFDATIIEYEISSILASKDRILLYIKFIESDL